MSSDYDIKHNYILPMDTKYWIYDSSKVKTDAIHELLFNPFIITLFLLTLFLIAILIIKRRKINKSLFFSTLLGLPIAFTFIGFITYSNECHKINKVNMVSKYYPTNQSFWSGDFSSGGAEAAAIPNNKPIVKNASYYSFLEGYNGTNSSYIYKYSVNRPNKYYVLKEYKNLEGSNVYFKAGEVDQSQDLTNTNKELLKVKENAVEEKFLKGKRIDVYSDKPDYTPYNVKGRHLLCKSIMKNTQKFNGYEVKNYKFDCINYR